MTLGRQIAETRKERGLSQEQVEARVIALGLRDDVGKPLTLSTAGLSRWLFVGQVTASLGFCVYSVMLRNWVFVFTNAMLLITAVVGQCIYLRNKRRGAPSDA